MGNVNPMRIVPVKQVHHNIFSKEKFKSVLEFCLRKNHDSNDKLIEQLLVGALAAVELDCIADLEDENMHADLTSQHYLSYVGIAKKVIRTSKTEREDIREFVDRISKLCYAKSGQESFL